MSVSQTKSKQRVADHGEVFTNEREVKAMVDLVADQAANPEKTFLEPACGNGNFLAEILKRKLAAVAYKHKKIQLDYERNAVMAVSSLYGIELLADNAQECRERLFQIFQKEYQSIYPKTAKPECEKTIRFVLSKNIICGNALDFKTADGNYIIFSEWKLTTGSLLQRRDYQFMGLLGENDEFQMSFFNDLGEQSLIYEPIKTYPQVHFLEIGNE